LNKYGAFEEALVKRFVRQILTGLEYLHARDIIHRDIKGANILVDNKGGIKISDFGISKKVESSKLTIDKQRARLITDLLNPAGRGAQNRQSLQGSVFWMAPEVVKQTGHSSKADIWSVGCLVVEMLTGSHPWPDLNQLQAMYQVSSSYLQ
jgi:mitogen-activated protein kinase kinase kinase